MHITTANKGVHMYDRLVRVIDGSGIWKGSRKESHAFLLSPDVYKLNKNQQQELEKLGFALYDCLLGLSHIAIVAYDPVLNYNGTWGVARKVFSTGVPKVYQELQGLNVRHIPRLLKVDLMVDQNGNFKIAEIDGHNKHGVGYSTLGLRFRDALFPEATPLPGVVNLLSQEIKRLGFSEVKLFYADQERFYIPEFEIARQEFQKYGISCQVVGEMEVEVSFLEQGLFLDLPFLYQRKELYDTIIRSYRSGRVSFIIPPKPFLGAKGVLALLRNDLKDPHLESLLHTFVKKPSLELIRQYIPETYLVGQQAQDVEFVKSRLTNKRYVLKESISSGMKGTVFSDGVDFDATLATACKSKMNWILQEEVQNQPQTFSWFESEHNLRTANDWFMRVTTQFVNRKLADVIITARRDKSVHGAKDCLQLGTIVL